MPSDAAITHPDVPAAWRGGPCGAREGGTAAVRPMATDARGDGAEAGEPQWLRFANGAVPIRAADGADPLPVLTAKRRAFVAQARRGGPKNARVIAQIRAKRVEAQSAAFAQSTKGLQLTAMRAFVEFCSVMGVDYLLFGATDDGRTPTPAQLGAEDEFLAEYACYVVMYPRAQRRGSAEYNTGATAASYVSHVRTWYEGRLVPPRRPGSCHAWGRNDHLGATLRRCLDGLRKVHPSTGAKRRPIERRVMVKLAQRLRGGDKWQRTKWAIYATCWQAGRRIGECIRSAKVTGPWDAARDMHRGRAEFLRGGNNGDGGSAGGRDGDQGADSANSGVTSIRVAIGPNKTDTSGEQDFHMHLPVAFDAEVNAGAALLELLDVDPTPVGRERETPMFRDWRPGRQGGMISYATIRRELEDDLRAIGEADLAAGPHSFRRGCATALGGIGAPEAVTKMIGIWGTNAYLGYTWASSPIVMSKMLEMAEWDGDVDAARGPVARRR